MKKAMYKISSVFLVLVAVFLFAIAILPGQTEQKITENTQMNNEMITSFLGPVGGPGPQPADKCPDKSISAAGTGIASFLYPADTHGHCWSYESYLNGADGHDGDHIREQDGWAVANAASNCLEELESTYESTSCGSCDCPGYEESFECGKEEMEQVQIAEPSLRHELYPHGGTSCLIITFADTTCKAKVPCTENCPV